MFDFSFGELAVIGTVALVVIGPERLPKVARTAGHMFGRLQRYVSTVKADINREIEASELAKVKQEVQDATRSFEHTMQDHAKSLEQGAAEIERSALAAPESTSAPSAPLPPEPPIPVAHISLDFGVEPLRHTSRGTSRS